MNVYANGEACTSFKKIDCRCFEVDVNFEQWFFLKARHFSLHHKHTWWLLNVENFVKIMQAGRIWGSRKWRMQNREEGSWSWTRYGIKERERQKRGASREDGNSFRVWAHVSDDGTLQHRHLRYARSIMVPLTSASQRSLWLFPFFFFPFVQQHSNRLFIYTNS